MAAPRTRSTATTAIAARAPTQPKEPAVDETGDPRKVLAAGEGVGAGLPADGSGDVGAGPEVGAGAADGVPASPEVAADAPDDDPEEPAASRSDPLPPEVAGELPPVEDSVDPAPEP